MRDVRAIFAPRRLSSHSPSKVRLRANWAAVRVVCHHLRRCAQRLYNLAIIFSLLFRPPSRNLGWCYAWYYSALPFRHCHLRLHHLGFRMKCGMTAQTCCLYRSRGITADCCCPALSPGFWVKPGMMAERGHAGERAGRGVVCARVLHCHALADVCRIGRWKSVQNEKVFLFWR